MRPSTQLNAERRRALLRQVVTARGPDTGRLVDRLKLRSGPGGDVAEQLLAGFETNGPEYARGTDLTVRSGNATLTLFVLDVSDLDGGDVLE